MFDKAAVFVVSFLLLMVMQLTKCFQLLNVSDIGYTRSVSVDFMWNEWMKYLRTRNKSWQFMPCGKGSVRKAQ